MKHTMKMMTGLLLLVLGTTLYSQTPRIEFTEFTLDNGLHVILHQDNTTPNVVVNIMYHVGSKNEAPDRTGFAHLFEHLMFEGSKNIARGEFDNIVEQAGGYSNAGTHFDYTNYYLLLPSNQLELGLWLESERLLHPNIDSVGIATQKSVITEELKQTRDNQPYGSLLVETLKRAYTQHPYRSDIGGKAEHLQASTDEEIYGFHNMYYVPNNAVLVVSGDIDLEKATKLVKKYFAGIPRGSQEISRPDFVEPVRRQEVRDTVYDNIQLPLILQAYHIPAQGTDDYYAMEMLGALLSQGQSSRMYRKMVVEEQTAIEVQAMPLGLEDPGLTIILALPNMGVDPAVVERGIDVELQRVRDELISEHELQKLKNQFENRLVNSNTTIASRATNLANYYTLYKDPGLINTELERYLAVTREDIKRVAQQYLRDDNRVVLYYLPKAQ